MRIGKRLLSLAGLVILSLAWGCRTGPAGASSAGATGVSHATAPADIPVPPGIDPEALAIRQGQALDKARMTLDRVVASLPLPSYLSTPAHVSAPPDVDPPLEAQHAYVEGREAWREHLTSEAINALQTADRLAPDSPAILRSLGEIYASMGNQLRAVLYFEQAAVLNPDDAESLFVLGRFALDQGKWDVAIVDFARALSLRGHSQGVDPGLWSFIEYSLAGALERGQYDSAAIALYLLTLNAPPAGAQTTHLVRQLAFLAHQQGYIWLAIGDAYNRLGQPAVALQAYQRGTNIDRNDMSPLWSRLAYTQLRLGRPDLAQAIALDAVRISAATPAAINLACFVAAHCSRPQPFIRELEQAYRQLNRPGALAVAIATLIGGSQGQEFLQAHLASMPSDAVVGEQLIRQALNGVSGRSASMAELVRVTTNTIAGSHQWARRYANIVLDSSLDPADLLAAADSLSADEQSKAAYLYLKGRLLRKLGQSDAAQSAFEDAVKADPAFAAPRVELVGLLVEKEDYAQAQTVLEPLDHQTDPESVGLRVAILAKTNHRDEALKLLDGLLAQPPLNINLVLEKAALQRDGSDPAGAERTLLDALDSQPRAEALYAALFDLYDTPGLLPDSDQQYERLMRRMLEQIPGSRIARLQRAGWLAANRNTGEAESILRGLLAENPRDYRVLDMLDDLLVKSNPTRATEAGSLIDRALAKAPRDRDLLFVALHHDQRVGDEQGALAISERLLLLMPPSPQRASDLASIYIRQHRFQDAINVINSVFDLNWDDSPALAGRLFHALLDNHQPEEAQRRLEQLLKRYPKDEADLTLAWASELDFHGFHDRAEIIEVDLLKRFPDDAKANNSLGYTWADEGRNLQKAKEMVNKACQADPSNSAYLDSMGWVYYKLGQFRDAVIWLRRAQAADQGDYPVILGHLGDANYRAGNLDSAMQAWRRGLERIPQYVDDEDPELAGLSDRLNQRIQAALERRSAPVASVPGMAGPAAIPEGGLSAPGGMQQRFLPHMP